MTRDFTREVYRDFLIALIDQGYHLTSYEEYLHLSDRTPDLKTVILRHDVDRLPQNSLATARLQASLGVKGSYYFRIVPQSFQPDYIEKIRDLGHEIGYHYEDLALSHGDPEQAIRSFEQNLARVREFYPVVTMCMHGSPLSQWDNRQLWEHYNYRDYGIRAEPYFDIDFHKMLYITDTGRQWNRTGVSVRDKVDTAFDYNFSSTFDLIEAIERDTLPRQIMQNIHPQRWNSNWWGWSQELIAQNAKNQVKRAIVQFQ
jgi:hypothetical protein